MHHVVDADFVGTDVYRAVQVQRLPDTLGKGLAQTLIWKEPLIMRERRSIAMERMELLYSPIHKRKEGSHEQGKPLPISQV